MLSSAQMDTEAHWNRVYGSKKPDEVSWYQTSPEESMRFIRQLGGTSARVIDVGAGASGLVDALLNAGYPKPIALDVSAEGLEHAKRRLGPRAELVDWIVGDVTSEPALPEVDLWHDRAVLHFLTQLEDQQAYAASRGEHGASGWARRDRNICFRWPGAMQRPSGPAA